MAEFGWAYVAGALAGGVSCSVQTATPRMALTGSDRLVFDHNTDVLNLSGSLYVSGSITANQYNVNVINETVTNLSASGNTRFGDTTDDTHIFTGSLFVSSSANPIQLYGLQSAPASSPEHFLALDASNNIVITSSNPLDYSNGGDNRIITSTHPSGIQGETNLTFDGSTLSLTGDMTASGHISSSFAYFDEMTGSTGRFYSLSVGTASVNITGQGISGAQLITSDFLAGTLNTSIQNNITSVGPLSQLTVAGNASFDTDTLYIDSEVNRIGIGTQIPTTPLEVFNSNTQLRLTNSKYVFGISEAKHTDLLTNNQGDLVITPSSGKLGIGTASPTANLDVIGDARITGDLTISGTLKAQTTDFVVSADTMTLGDEITDTVIINAGTITATNGLNFNSGKFVLGSDGNVGIGTSNAGSPLEVNSGLAQIAIADNPANAVKFKAEESGDFRILVAGDDTTLESHLTISGNLNAGLDSNSVSNISGTLNVLTRITTPELVTPVLSADTLTDGHGNISSGSISGFDTISATSIIRTLTTPSQGNITSLGTLTTLNVSGDLDVDSGTLHVDSGADRVGIRKTNPQRTLEVKDTEKQLRLTYSDYVFGISADVNTDIGVNSSGYLSIVPSGARVGIATDNPTKTLEVNGDGQFNGDVHVSGTLFAEQVKVTLTEVQVVHLSSTGSTSFGDTSDDIHTFKGTVVYTGGVVYNRKSISSNYSMTSEDYLIGIRANQNTTITLPSASSLLEGQSFIIKDELGTALEQSLKVQASPGDTIDGLASITIPSPHTSFNLYTDGSGAFFIL